MGYSDDFQAIVKGLLPLKIMLKKVEDNLKKINIGINKDKSAVMQVLAPNGRNKYSSSNIYGIPLVKSFPYLGVMFDQRLNMQQEVEIKKKRNRTLLKKSKWILRSPKLNEASRWEIWQSLFKSKTAYAQEVLWYHNAGVRKLMKQLWA